MGFLVFKDFYDNVPNLAGGLMLWSGDEGNELSEEVLWKVLVGNVGNEI